MPDYGLDDQVIDWSLSKPLSSPGTPEKFTPRTKQYFMPLRGQTGQQKASGRKVDPPQKLERGNLK